MAQQKQPPSSSSAATAEVGVSSKIVIVGFGNMGKALARGLAKTTAATLYVCDRPHVVDDADLPDGLTRDRFTYVPVQEKDKHASALALSDGDTLVLATKPQNFIDACEDWRGVVLAKGGRPLVISILAGIPTEMIHKFFDDKCPVVRAMPNIAATVDASATALCASRTTSLEHARKAKAIFDCVGRSWIVVEDQLNAVTGLSGSGPAYIYMVIEALSDGGVKMGLPRQLSLDLAAQTVLGAAQLVQSTGEHPAVLRDQVTTPGGTTISAIHELEKHGLRPMLISAVVTATKKSATLAKTVYRKLSRKPLNER